jgi:hypothetical protein
MKMNTRMSQLLSLLNVPPAPNNLPASAKSELLELIVVDGSVLLKREFEQAKGATVSDFPDRTGFEAFVNHVHRPYDETSESLQTCLYFATKLRNRLAEIKEHQFVVILSVSEGDCVVRFHQLRQGEKWLDDDLETYTEEGILVFSGRDF